MTKKDRELLVTVADVLTDVLHFWRQSNARRSDASCSLGLSGGDDLRHEKDMIKLCADRLDHCLGEVVRGETARPPKDRL